jgi:hypothetical protein
VGNGKDNGRQTPKDFHAKEESFLLNDLNDPNDLNDLNDLNHPNDLNDLNDPTISTQNTYSNLCKYIMDLIYSYFLFG